MLVSGLMLLSAEGCEHTEDLTYSSQFGKPVANRRFRLLQDSKIDVGEGDLYLWAERYSSPQTRPIPSSTEQYTVELAKHHESVLPRGTVVCITKLIRKETFEDEYIDAYGIINTGPLIGRKVVIIGFVRQSVGTYTFFYDLAPDPEFFEDCDDASKGKWVK